MFKVKNSVHRLQNIFFLVVFFIIANRASSLGAYISNTELSADTITVGDKVALKVSVTTEPGKTVQPPETDTGFGDFRVLSWTTDRISKEASDSVVHTYIITAYETKICSLPPLPYIVPLAEGADTMYTEPHTLLVASVIDTDSAYILDIKPPQKAGKQSLLWLWILLGAVAVAAIIFLVILYTRVDKKGAAPPPPPPPYDEAVAALRNLEHKNLLRQGKIREYVFELSEILKRYIGRRFSCNAQEYTTEEILRWIRHAPLDKGAKTKIDWFFRASDPVKFARLIPDSETVERFYKEAWAFLDMTRPSLEPADTDTTEKEGEQSGT